VSWVDGEQRPKQSEAPKAARAEQDGPFDEGVEGNDGVALEPSGLSGFRLMLWKRASVGDPLVKRDARNQDLAGRGKTRANARV
jgi:hypothetical protein